MMWEHEPQGTDTENILYYVPSSVSGQDEPNLAL